LILIAREEIVAPEAALKSQTAPARVRLSPRRWGRGGPIFRRAGRSHRSIARAETIFQGKEISASGASPAAFLRQAQERQRATRATFHVRESFHSIHPPPSAAAAAAAAAAARFSGPWNGRLGEEWRKKEKRREVLSNNSPRALAGPSAKRAFCTATVAAEAYPENFPRR